MSAANPGWSTANCDDGYVSTAPAASFAPNPFGLYDAHGEVWEMVEDCWSSTYEGAPSDGSPRLDAECRLRMLRGGSWFDDANGARSAYRSHGEFGFRDVSVGFRVPRDIAPRP